MKKKCPHVQPRRALKQAEWNYVKNTTQSIIS